MILHIVSDPDFIIRAVVVFGIFVGLCIALIVAVEIEYHRAVERKKLERELTNVISIVKATDENMFEKIEEFRNDFDGYRQSS